MTNQPLISVIIPNHNNADFLGEAIQSVLDQTYPNWEALLLDDASIDNTEALVTEYAKADSRIRYIKLDKQVSVYKVRNIGIELAQGELIAFLDGDDKYFPNAFEMLLDTLNQHPDVWIAKGFNTTMDEQSIPMPNKGVGLVKDAHGHLSFPPGFQIDWPTIFNAKFPCQLGSGLYRRDVFENIGPFRSELTHTDDYGFFIRLFIQAPSKIMFIPQNILEYRAQRNSITKKSTMVDQVTNCHLKVLDHTFAHPELPAEAKTLEQYTYAHCFKRLARRQLNYSRPQVARNILHQAWQHPQICTQTWLKTFSAMYLQSFFPVGLYQSGLHFYKSTRAKLMALKHPSRPRLAQMKSAL